MLDVRFFRSGLEMATREPGDAHSNWLFKDLRWIAGQSFNDLRRG